MVFQEPRLLPWRTVSENVRLVAPQLGDAELAKLFDILGLTDHRAHYPGELSLGLARRVALARLRGQAGAPAARRALRLARRCAGARLRDELALLVDRQSITTLLVTHDIDEAVRLADRVLLLSPRPASVVAEMPILTPRAARTDDAMMSIKATLASRLAAAAARE